MQKGGLRSSWVINSWVISLRCHALNHNFFSSSLSDTAERISHYLFRYIAYKILLFGRDLGMPIYTYEHDIYEHDHQGNLQQHIMSSNTADNVRLLKISFFSFSFSLFRAYSSYSNSMLYFTSLSSRPHAGAGAMW